MLGLTLLAGAMLQGCAFNRMHTEHRELVREVYATQIETYQGLQEVIFELSQEYGIIEEHYRQMGQPQLVELMSQRAERFKYRYQLISERLQAMEQRMSAYLREENLRAPLAAPAVDDPTFAAPVTPAPPQLTNAAQSAAAVPATATTASGEPLNINVIKSPAEGIPPQIFVNGRSVQAETLAPMLADMKANNPGLQINIRADQDAPFALVSKVIDAARAAGVTPQLQSN
jgi:hypothetical protein